MSITALSAATLDEPKGNLEGDHQTFTIDTNDQLLTAQAYRNVIVAYRNGAPVRLQDVGRRHRLLVACREPARGMAGNAANC